MENTFIYSHGTWRFSWRVYHRIVTSTSTAEFHWLVQFSGVTQRSGEWMTVWHKHFLTTHDGVYKVMRCVGSFNCSSGSDLCEWGQYSDMGVTVLWALSFFTKKSGPHSALSAYPDTSGSLFIVMGRLIPPAHTLTNSPTFTHTSSHILPYWKPHHTHHKHTCIMIQWYSGMYGDVWSLSHTAPRVRKSREKGISTASPTLRDENQILYFTNQTWSNILSVDLPLVGYLVAAVWEYII